MIRGRQSELHRLQTTWDRAAAGEPQMVLLTGRRRVGKTALVAEFARGRRCVVFTSTREAMPRQLARFAERLGQVSNATPVPAAFASWHEAFAFVRALAIDEPLLIAIDEVPYLDEVDSSFGSVLQAAWDGIVHGESRPGVMLLLTGSSRRVMDRLTSGGGPLFGRADTHIRLEPFRFEECGVFLGELSPRDRLEVYSVLGGYPRHLLAWNASESIAANLDRLVRPGELLFDDAPLIVNEEFPSGLGFERVLHAIGRGRHAFGEIKTEADLRVEGPLATLSNVGLVRGETPLGGPRRAAPHYVIADPYLRFWFGPFARIRQGVEIGGDPSQVLSTGVWESHVAGVFEDEARRHAVRAAQRGELPPATYGRFWRAGRHPVELDVVGRAEDRVLFAGEAKWSDREDLDALASSLRDRANAAFGEDPQRRFAIWTRRRLEHRDESVTYGVDDLAV